MARFVCAVAFFALFTDCQNSTGPANVAGYYVLTTVDSVAVPHLVSATPTCDELVVRGVLRLANNSSFDLSITQAQDCTRVGGTADTFTTTTSGAFSLDRTQLALHPVGTGLQLLGTVSGGAVDLQLPQLPLLGSSPHSGAFLIFPQ